MGLPGLGWTSPNNNCAVGFHHALIILMALVVFLIVASSTGLSEEDAFGEKGSVCIAVVVLVAFAAKVLHVKCFKINRSLPPPPAYTTESSISWYTFQRGMMLKTTSRETEINTNRVAVPLLTDDTMRCMAEFVLDKLPAFFRPEEGAVLQGVCLSNGCRTASRIEQCIPAKYPHKLLTLRPIPIQLRGARLACCPMQQCVVNHCVQHRAALRVDALGGDLRTGILLGITSAHPATWLWNPPAALASVPRCLTGRPRCAVPFRLRSGSILAFVLEENRRMLYGQGRPGVRLYVDGNEVGREDNSEICLTLFRPEDSAKSLDFFLVVDLQFDVRSLSILDANSHIWPVA